MIALLSGYGQDDGSDAGVSPVDMYLPSTQVSPGMPHTESPLAVIGVVLAFFSTLMFVSNLVIAGSRAKG